MYPTNSFIDEAAMKPEGEPLEYIKPTFPNIDSRGLVVKDISIEEYNQARQEWLDKQQAELNTEM